MKPQFKPLFSVPSKSSLAASDRFRLRSHGGLTFAVLPEGIWFTPNPVTKDSKFTPLKIPPGEVQNFYEKNGAWFLLKSPGADGSVLMRSDDAGLLWTRIDEGLRDASNHPLTPTRMAFWNETLFVNAGGGINVLSSTNSGKTWNVLAGKMASQSAYPGELFVRNQEVIVGGEAPLDFAYLRKGSLNLDGSGWKKALESVAPADISNRNVQFIESTEDLQILFAGVEGGLLKSTDTGKSWQWSQKFEQGGKKYPYIQQILSSASSSEIWVGGFDKANELMPYLALSLDGGQSWKDLSSVFKTSSTLQDVLCLQRTGTGDILCASFDTAKMVIEFGIIEL